MPKKDTRVTMKIDKPLWDRMEKLIRDHPEWGILSVPEYVRRAIDSDIRSRRAEETSKVINVCLSAREADRRRKGR